MSHTLVIRPAVRADINAIINIEATFLGLWD